MASFHLVRRTAAAFAAMLAVAPAVRAEPRALASELKALGLSVGGAPSWLRDANRPARPETFAYLPGADRKLKGETVLVAVPPDAFGEAVMLSVARDLAAAPRARRTILLALAASREAAPSRDAAPVVAELDLQPTEAPGPPLAFGLEDSSLGPLARSLAPALGAELRPAGEARPAAGLTATPALVLRGAPPATLAAALARSVADEPTRPVWLPGSRFAPASPLAEPGLVEPVDLPISHRHVPAAERLG